MSESVTSEYDSFSVERGTEGAVLVRVRSSDPARQQLPDAVFTFRPGDPQYRSWAKQLRREDRLSDG